MTLVHLARSRCVHDQACWRLACHTCDRFIPWLPEDGAPSGRDLGRRGPYASRADGVPAASPVVRGQATRRHPEEVACLSFH